MSERVKSKVRAENKTETVTSNIFKGGWKGGHHRFPGSVPKDGKSRPYVLRLEGVCSLQESLRKCK